MDDYYIENDGARLAEMAAIIDDKRDNLIKDLVAALVDMRYMSDYFTQDALDALQKAKDQGYE